MKYKASQLYSCLIVSVNRQFYANFTKKGAGSNLHNCAGVAWYE